MTKHAKLSPSSSHRWSVCPKSIHWPDEETKASEAAMEGTAAHTVCEHCLKNNIPPRNLLHKNMAVIVVDGGNLGSFVVDAKTAKMVLLSTETRTTISGKWSGLSIEKLYNKSQGNKPKTKYIYDIVKKPGVYYDLDIFPIDSEMLDAVSVFVNYVWEKMEEYKLNSEHLKLEDRIHYLPQYEDDGFGTGDVQLDDGFDYLHLIDYKHGAGVYVQTRNKETGELNSQLMCYLLGCAISVDFEYEEYRITIVQPRIASEEGIIRTEIVTKEEILEFQEKINEAADQALNNPRKAIAGSHCTFCPGEGRCPAREAYILSKFEDEYADEPEEIPTDRLEEVYSDSNEIKSWLKAVENELFNRLAKASTYEEFTRYRLGKSQGHRKLNPTVTEKNISTWLAEKGLKVPIVDTKLKTGPAILKELPSELKDEFEQLFIERPETLKIVSKDSKTLDPKEPDFDDKI